MFDFRPPGKATGRRLGLFGRSWRAPPCAGESILPDLAALVGIGGESEFHEVLGGSPDPLLALFDAPWCEPGRTLAALLPRLNCPDLRAGPALRLVRIDVDALPHLARRYGVAAAPMLVLFRDAQMVARRIGNPDPDELIRWLAQHL